MASVCAPEPNAMFQEPVSCAIGQRNYPKLTDIHYDYCMCQGPVACAIGWWNDPKLTDMHHNSKQSLTLQAFLHVS